jgi:hypothetical protein
MTLHEVSARRKLAVWRTVRSCYATVLQNLDQLVRISWLWLLVMVPVYAAAHWLVSNVWELPGIPPMPRWVHVIAVVLPLVVELPFLASIAVAWHRLVLRHERISASAYLRLDTSVWLYVLYSLVFLAITIAPVLCAVPSIGQSASEILLSLLIAALIALTLAAPIFLLPRLSIVLPALALGERLSLWEAWRATRGNTLRLALATCLCMLPALFLIILLPLLSFLLWSPSWEDMQQMQEWTRATPQNFIDRILDSVSYAVFNSLAYAVLTIFAVTLLSLAYRLFAGPGREDAAPPA